MKYTVLQQQVRELPIFKDHALNQTLFKSRALVNCDNEEVVKVYAKHDPILGVDDIVAANLAAELGKHNDFNELDFGQELAVWKGLVQSKIYGVRRNGSLDDSFTAALITATTKDVDHILSDKKALTRITNGSELRQEHEIRLALKRFYIWAKSLVKDIVIPVA